MKKSDRVEYVGDNHFFGRDMIGMKGIIQKIDESGKVFVKYDELKDAGVFVYGPGFAPKRLKVI